ncbi:MAG: DUF5320 domain-containing protein [Synergistales bacterium]|nr:DUF5320 domain-containing protein [Synergistales bacterium]
MPGGDRTGPAGYGPMTGRAAGYCAGNGAPGFTNPWGGRGFRGGGRGPGWGWGGGPRWGMRWGAPAGPAPAPGPYAYGGYPPQPQPPSAQDERAMLQQELKAMQQQMDAVQKRLEELDTEE